MGAGKSTVGRRLAEATGLTFCDSDHEIVESTGVSIPTIFDIEGEAGFRDREQRALESLCAMDNIVLATGGGAVTREENRHTLANSAFVVYLRASVAQQLKRAGNDRNRPLLQTADPEKKLRELFELRDPLYQDVADFQVNTDRRKVNAVVREICQALPESLSCGGL